MISQLHKNKTRHTLINNRSLLVVPRNLEVGGTNECYNHPFPLDIERIDSVSTTSRGLTGRLFFDGLQDDENPLFQSQPSKTPDSGSPRSCYSHLSSPEPIFDEERIKELLELVEEASLVLPRSEESVNID